MLLGSGPFQRAINSCKSDTIYLPDHLDPKICNAPNSFNSSTAKAIEISQLIRYLQFLSLFCERRNPLRTLFIFTQKYMPCKAQHKHQSLDHQYCWVKSGWASSSMI